VPDDVDYSFLETVRAELEAAGRVDSWQGQLLLELAKRMCEPQSASHLVALSKELSRTLAAINSAPSTAPDPLDEIRARRDAKRRLST
jgi:hypothetical protein